MFSSDTPFNWKAEDLTGRLRNVKGFGENLSLHCHVLFFKWKFWIFEKKRKEFLFGEILTKLVTKIRLYDYKIITKYIDERTFAL